VPVDAPQPVVHDRDVGAVLTDVGGVEPADLEFDDDVAQLLDVEQQQVQHQLVAVDVDVDVEPHLPADERHAVPKRQQRVLQPVHQGLLELALHDPLGQRQVIEHVRVAPAAAPAPSPARAERPRSSRHRPDPTRSASRVSTWWTSTSRDHPYSPAAAAYQSRS